MNCDISYVADVTLRPFAWLNGVLFLDFLFPEIEGGLVALGAFLGTSRCRRFMYCAVVLTLCRTIGLLVLFGSLEAPTTGSWWAYARYTAPAYPIGAVMSSMCALYVIVESFG